MAQKLSIMIVDDEAIVRESFRHWFAKDNHRVDVADSGAQALEKLAQVSFDLLFVDIKMPGMDGIALLEKVKSEYPEISVVIITAYGTIESAVRAMKIGAADFLLKPFKPDQLTLVMEKVAQQRKLTDQCNYLRDRLEKISRFENIIGQSGPMQAVFALIPEVAVSDAAVLLTGETGTGKELVAKAIHAKSRRANFPFIAVNCGAIPDSLIESELFGHTKGAFTGADRPRKGYVEVAGNGTLFLDEIGEISLKMQVDLLRVLEEKKVARIGSSHPIETGFRLIAATSRRLEDQIATGAFRSDFFYRINVLHIEMPPLRQRREDIPLLAEHFIKKYSHETTKQIDRITPNAQQMLCGYPWPGNVRELENAIERAVVLSKSRTLGNDDFAFLKITKPLPADDRSLRAVEIDHIGNVLQRCHWNITRAAHVLGINRATLH